MTSLKERLLAKADVDPLGCWVWEGATKDTGYPLIWRDGRHRRAHIESYNLFVGPVPDGLELDHLCNVRHCVNPMHLEPVTHAENLRRAGDRIFACPKGHVYPKDERKACKPCINTAISARRAANPEAYRERDRKYYNERYADVRKARRKAARG